MLKNAPLTAQQVWWPLLSIVLAVGVYSYFSQAPARQLGAICAAVQPGTSAGNLQRWAISHGADPERTRWSGTRLTIAVRTGVRPFLATCEVQTEAGRVTSVSKAL